MEHWIEAVHLRGEHVQLDPLTREDAKGLAEAAADGALWRLWYTSVPHPEHVASYIDTALDWRARLASMPFVVRRSGSGEVLGCTRFFHVDAVNRRLEIGHTWYAKRAQRSAVNTECKLLLLQHAFEALSCIAVEFRTHWMNHASRTAIARLGAKQDGVLRHHAIAEDGVIRDTVVFSIIAPEWPTVRCHLRNKLERAC